MLALQKADFGSKGVVGEDPHFEEIESLIVQIIAENSCLSIKDLAVNGHDLIALGLSGKEIGNAFNTLLDAVLEERLPNEKEALLQAVTENQLSR
jgi:tRNA nucleotidyltransferase (CCA-adding enzyme)